MQLDSIPTPMASSAEETAAAAALASSVDHGLVSRLREVLLSAEEQTFSIQSKERRLTKQSETIEALSAEGQRLKQENEEQQGQIAELQSFTEKQQEHICKLQRSVQEAKKVRNGYETSLKAIEQRATELEQQIQERDKSQEKLEAALERARLEALSSAERVRETEAILAQTKQISEKRTSELRQRCVALQTAASTADVELSSLKSELSTLRISKEDTLEELKILKESYSTQQDSLQHARGAASRSEEDVVKLRDQVHSLETQVKAQRLLVEEAHKEQSEAEDTLRKVSKQAEEDKGFALAKSQHLQNKLDHLEMERDQQVQKLQQEMKQTKKELDQVKKLHAEEITREKETHASSIRGLTTRLNGLQQSVEQQQRILQETRAERDEKINELSKSKIAYEDISAALESSKVELARILEREKMMFHNHEEASKAAQDQASKANSKIEELEHKVQRLTRDHQNAEEALASKVAELTDTKGELTRVRQQAEDTSQRLMNNLQSERDSLVKVRKEFQKFQEEQSAEVHLFRERERKGASELQRVQEGSQASLKVEQQKREALASELNTRNGELQAAIRERDVLASQLVQAKATIKQIGDKQKETEARLGVMEASSKSTQQKLRVSQEELQRISKEAASAQQSQAERYQSHLRKLADEYELTKANLAKSQDRCGLLEARNTQVQQTMAAQIVGLNEKARAYHQQSEGLRNEIARLKASIQVMSSKESQIAEAAEVTKRELSSKLQIFDKRVRQAEQEKITHEAVISKLKQDFASEKQAMQRMAEIEQQKTQEELEKTRWKASRLEEELNNLQVDKAALTDKFLRTQDENKRLVENEQSLMKLYKSMADPSTGSKNIPVATNNGTKYTSKLQLSSTSSMGSLRKQRPQSAAARVSRRPAPGGKKKPSSGKPRLIPITPRSSNACQEEPVLHSPASVATTESSEADNTPRNEDLETKAPAIRSVADILRRKQRHTPQVETAYADPSLIVNNQTDLSPTEVKNYLDQFLRNDVE